jgi:hypothetical protein
MQIKTAYDVIGVRDAAACLAESLHFDGFSTNALATAASELAHYVVDHGGGTASVEKVEDAVGVGIRVVLEAGSNVSEDAAIARARHLIDVLDVEPSSIRVVQWRRAHPASRAPSLWATTCRKCP